MAALGFLAGLPARASVIAWACVNRAAQQIYANAEATEGFRVVLIIGSGLVVNLLIAGDSVELALERAS